MTVRSCWIALLFGRDCTALRYVVTGGSIDTHINHCSNWRRDLLQIILIRLINGAFRLFLMVSIVQIVPVLPGYMANTQPTHTRARTHARPPARARARTHTHIHIHTHIHTHTYIRIRSPPILFYSFNNHHQQQQQQQQQQQTIDSGYANGSFRVFGDVSFVSSFRMIRQLRRNYVTLRSD
jgi:hypothetical protein